MDELINLLKNYSIVEVIVILILVFVAIEWVYNKVKKIVDMIKAKKKDYHEEESLKEEKEESINEEIAHLKENDRIQNEKIDKITELLDTNTKVLTQMQQSQDEVTIATCRNTLRELHDEFVKKGYVSQDDLDTFLDIGAVYEKAGGNGTYHFKLKPEVLALPFK